MLDPTSLRRALDVQKRSYALLRWTVDELERGLTRFDVVHASATREEAAVAWLREQHASIPEDARPALDDLDAFARFFTGYVDTSFDLVESPGKRLYGPGCHCELCAWLVDMPMLRPKRVTDVDKHRARILQRGALSALAAAHGLPAPADALASDATLREDLALVAWARDLFERLAGSPGTAATLALWRTFAWKPEGSPKVGYEVTAEKILDAEARLLARLRSA